MPANDQILALWRHLNLGSDERITDPSLVSIRDAFDAAETAPQAFTAAARTAESIAKGLWPDICRAYVDLVAERDLEDLALYRRAEKKAGDMSSVALAVAVVDAARRIYNERSRQALNYEN